MTLGSVVQPPADRLSSIVADVAARSPGRPAVIEDNRTLTYAELHGLSMAAAKSLLAAGIRRGDRVGVLLGNQHEWVVMALAASYIGAAFVPLNTWYKATELAWTIRHCGLGILVSASQFLKANFADLLLKMIPEANGSGDGMINSINFPRLRRLVFVGSNCVELYKWEDFLRSGACVSDVDLAVAGARVTALDTAFILYTSGSTAEPKGVLLNHEGVVGNGFQLGLRRGIVEEDRVWIGTPLFYGLGATNALPATFTRGATLVLQGHFNAGRAIEVIERTCATVYYGTGNMTRAMLDHPDYRQARIGSLTKGNAGTVAEYKRLTIVEMGIRDAVPAYGLTECYGNATVGWPDDPLSARIDTSGTPVEGMEVLIVDVETGRPLPPDEVGLVLLRGRTTPGYLDNPEETARALRPDGFFDTGDLGSLDRSGRFIFHARLKEVIKSGGINVSPVEVEQILSGHPDVRDAYVVGIPDVTKGELVVAFVDAATQMSAEALQGYVKERVASFKVPHHIFFRNEAQLPRLASGKVAKFKLAEEARRELGCTTS